MTATSFFKSIGIIMVALAAMVILAAVIGMLAPEREALELQYDGELEGVLPDARLFEKADDEVPYYIGYDDDGNPVGFAFVTTNVASENATWGFGGTVPVLVGMDMDGRITGLKELANHETPSYAEPVFSESFFNQFIGKQHSDEFLVGVDIDGVSGATVSSEAVAGGVGEAAGIIAGIVLDHPYQPRPTLAKQIRLTNPANLILIALVAIAIAGNRLRIRWLRYVVLGLSVAILGFQYGYLLSVRHFVGLFVSASDWIAALFGSGDTVTAGRLAAGISWFLPLILAGIAAFFVGRVWCGWICPFGAITELMGRLFPWKLNIPPKIDRRARLIKYGVLIVAPALFLFFGGNRALLFEPFADTLNLSFLRLPLFSARVIWLIVLAVASLFIVRFYCRYLCAVGAGLGFIAGRSPMVEGGPQDCLECAKCDKPCVNAGNIPSRDMSASECLACGESTACSKIRKAKKRRKERAKTSVTV